MNTEILIAVFVTLVGCGGVGAMALIFYVSFQRQKRQVEALAALIPALKELAASSEKMVAAVKLVAEFPRYIQGQVLASRMLTMEIQKFRMATDRLTGILTAAPKRDMSAYSVSHEEDADKRYRVAEIAAEHPDWDIEQAMAQAEQEQKQYDMASMPNLGVDSI